VSKPRLLYASPFPPMQSGISEYSRYLVEGLAEFFDITLFTGDYELSDAALRRQFRVVKYQKGQDGVLAEHPYRLYNIGNNPWYHDYIYESCLAAPGVVILHDAVIYYLVVGLYQDRPDFLATVYRLEGARGVALIKEQLKCRTPFLEYSEAHLLPFLGELLSSGNKILVHSGYALRLIENRFPAHPSLGRIDKPIPIDSPSCEENLAEMRWRIGVPPEATLICSFGFVAPVKLNHLVCEAVKVARRRTGRAVYYCMVGQGNYTDPYLSDFIRVTGYVPDSVYNDYLRCADLVVNLRYPSMGETSIALLRAMALGKPCIVTGHAWFAELPDSVALKTGIPGREDVAGQLVRAFECFLSDPGPFHTMGRAAAEYVRRRHTRSAAAERLRQYLVEPQAAGLS